MTTSNTRTRKPAPTRRDIPVNAADLALAAETLRTAAAQDDTTTRSLARVAALLERESTRKSQKEQILYARHRR